MSVLQRLYDNEINFKVETFWDGGFDITLGDPMNGVDASTSVRTWAEAEAWLAERAAALYPNRDFATRLAPTV